MSKSSFAVLIACGCLVACLPRLAAPSDNYISDSLGMSDKSIDFYITYQPESIVAPNSYDPVYLICQTNIYDGVSYQWQFSYDGVYAWSDLSDKHSNEQVFALESLFAQHFGFYRCSCTYGDTTIYTAPFSITVPYSKKQVEKEEPTEELKEEIPEEIKEELPEEELIKGVEVDE